jgi:hypothetical protein
MSTDVVEVVPCVDRSPVPCLEDGCPAPELSCAWLAKNDACPLRFSDLWARLPSGYEALSSLLVKTECPASCGTCTESGLRAAVSGAPLPWPTGVLRAPEQLPGDASSTHLAAAIEAATVRGPLIITDAYGAAFRPEAWSRAALQARCAPPPGVHPSPPWPTIAWADPSLTGAMRGVQPVFIGSLRPRPRRCRRRSLPSLTPPRLPPRQPVGGHALRQRRRPGRAGARRPHDRARRRPVTRTRARTRTPALARILTLALARALAPALALSLAPGPEPGPWP